MDLQGNLMQYPSTLEVQAHVLQFNQGVWGHEGGSYVVPESNGAMLNRLAINLNY